MKWEYIAVLVILGGIDVSVEEDLRRVLEGATGETDTRPGVAVPDEVISAFAARFGPHAKCEEEEKNYIDIRVRGRPRSAVGSWLE